MNEELKAKLLGEVTKVQQSLDILDSCSDILGEYEKDVSLVRSWINIIERDVHDGIIPDSQVKMLLIEIISVQSAYFGKSKAFVTSEVRRFETSGRRNGSIPFFNTLRKASHHYYAYLVLRSIGFAQQNTVIVGPNGSGKTTLANCFTSSIHKSTGIVIPAQKLLFIPHITGIPLPEEIDQTYNNYQLTLRDTKQTYEYRNGNDITYDLVIVKK